ncbi:phage tail tape measure protein [Geobacillus stearothermophilus]|uniref:phage tail tape measure protein n=1 Tax=Geobacillus stearothermophilus TaxID=1422 RepID=UPI003D1BB389
MAETVRGISVVISGDTTKLGKALEDVNKKGKEIQGELRQIERLLKFDPKNTTLLAQKQQLLSRAIENTSEKLNRLKSVQQQVNEQFQRGEISEGQYRAFQREIEKTEGQLRSLQSRLGETDGAINKHTTTWGRLQESLNRVGQNLRDVGQRMQNVGQSMAVSMGAAATAIGGALGFAVKKSMDFEAQIDRVGAIAGATPAEIKKLEQAALDLGASTSKSATEVAQGMEIMGAMGYNTNQILAAMPGIIAAAEASGEDMALVADTVSAALNSFGLEASEASRVADVLAQAANDSAAGIQDMQYTFKYAAPVAKSLGISLEQLAAATEIMANNGIRGEQAGTTLRAALIRLSDPPREAANTLKDLGVKITDANGKMLPFSNIIGQLAEKTKNMSNAQKLAALSTIFGTEAASGMLTVVEAGPQKLDALTKSLQNSGGASQEAAKKMKDNLKGSLEELQGAFETAQITIGNALAPAIQKVAGYIQQLVDWFNNLSPSTQQFITTAAAVAAVLAGIGTAIGVVLATIGTAASGIGVLTAAFGAVSGAIAAAGGMAGVFSAAIAAITGPVGIAIAAIAGLIAIGIAVYKNWDTIKAKAIEIWGAIKQWFSTTLESIKQSFNNAWNNIKSFTSSTWSTIKQITVSVWNAIKSGVIAIVTPFINGIKNLFNGMKDGLQQIFNGLKQFFSGVWQAIKNIFLGAVLLIIDLVTGDFKNLSNDARAIFNNLKNALSSIWNGIKQVFSGAVSAIKGFVSAAWSNIQSTTSSVFNGIRSLASSIWNGIKSAISSAVNTAKSAVSSAFSAMRSAVSSIMSGIKSTIVSMWNSAVSFLKSIDLFTIGKNIIQGLINGIGSMARSVAEKVKELAESVPAWIRKMLGIHSPSRETEKLGRYTGEGFAKGIESKKKDVEASSKRTAEAAKKAFEEQFKSAQYNFKIGKIDESQYISRLRTILKEYAKTADQVRQVNLEIKKVQDEQAKKTAEIAKKTFEQGKQAIEYQKQIRNVSLEQELQWWNNLAKQFKKGTKERIEAEKEYARVKEEITKRNFENEKKWFEEKKYYGQLSLAQELESLNTVAKRYKKGTEERIYWEREIYRVKKEINDKLLAANNEYAEKVKEINERLQQDELKAKEEYETRVKEINDRLAEDERKLTEEYQKAVDDRTKALYSFAGIFDEIKRKDDVTGQGLLKNLSDQVSAFKDWQANIVSLANRGIDEGLLQELREMGPKAVDEIAALNSLSDEELNQYVQLWREKNALARTQAINELEGMRLETQSKIQQLRATASTELEQVKIEYTNKIAQLRAQAAAELEQHKNEWMAKIKEITEGTKTELNLMTASMADIGKNTMQGLIDGLNSMMGPLRQKAQEIANVVQATIKNALKIKSPSRVMMELGKWIPAGLAEGINRNINAVVSATNRMAQETIPSVAGYSGAVVPATATINVPKMAGAKIEQHFHFHSTAPTPSETARKHLQVSRQLAMEWGL